MPSNMVQLRANYLVTENDTANNIQYMVKNDSITGNPVAMSDSDAVTSATHYATALQRFAPLFTNFAGLMSVDWCWNEAVGVGPLHIGNYSGAPMPWVGTAAGEQLPSGISLSISFRTGRGGRDKHGRLYVAALAEGAVDGSDANKLSAGNVAAVPGYCAGFESDFNWNNVIAGVGNNFTHVVASFVKNKAFRVTASYTTVTSAGLRDIFVDYQRRRAPAHARHH